jgi:aldose 1-epimerase
MDDGTKIWSYTLANANGYCAEVMNYGAVLLSLSVKDKDGNFRDVVLGCGSLEGYYNNGSCLGATVGRSANRIKDGRFVINGKEYILNQNDGPNNLHSGPDMYYNRVWNVESVQNNAVTFSLVSPDGDQGFPGTLKMEVTYLLTEDNELILHYQGISDKDTIINMTNHSYFNLDGHKAGSILNHEVQICGDFFTETDSRLIPNGKLLPVKNTPLDFTEFKELGRDIAADYEPLRFGSGYDQNWAIRDYDGTIRRAAVLRSQNSGITMEVYTDLPGIQMYTGNFLDVEQAKEGASYTKREGVALETQFFPDAVHHENFVSPVFAAGQEYDTVTIYKFI